MSKVDIIVLISFTSINIICALQAMDKTYSGKSYSSKRRRILERVNEHLAFMDAVHTADSQPPPTVEDAPGIEANLLQAEVDDKIELSDCASEENRLMGGSKHCSEGDSDQGLTTMYDAAVGAENDTDIVDPVDDEGAGTSQPSDNENKVDQDHAERLREWAVQHGISHMAVTDLLHILSKVPVPGLPTSARTLLKTERSTDVKKKAGGEYFYFGITETLQSIAGQMKKFIRK